MAGFIGRRLLLAIPTLWLLSTVVFFVGYFSPTDPVTVMLGQHADPEARDRLRRQFGLDDPVLVQYGRFLSNAIRGDFGISFSDKQPVVASLVQRYPLTVRLGVAAITLAVLVGVPLGLIAATYHDRWPDRFCTGLALLGVSVPSFVVGPLLLIVFAQSLGLVSIGFRDDPMGYLLPAIALGSRPAALIARMTRASTVEALSQDFVRTARAKGLGGRAVLLRHAFRTAIIPVLTVIGTSAGYLLGGSFVVETIFGIQGIGYLSIEAIRKNDFPMIQAVTLLGATAFILINLAVDIIYGFLDPRIRAAQGTA